VGWKRFQAVATSEILPVLHEAKETLESAGLDVSITDLDEETRCLGFYVNDVGLFFTPAEDGLTVCFMARRFTGKEQGYESGSSTSGPRQNRSVVWLRRPYSVSSGPAGPTQ